MSYQGFSDTYRSARTRSRVAVAFLAATGLVLLLSAFHDVSGFEIISKAEAGTLTDSEATLYDQAMQAYAGLYLVAFVATAIAYLAWLSRTVDNVPKLTTKLPEVTPRWSIGWWFVPIANLVKPYQIVKDVNSLLAAEGAAVGNGIVLAWWIAWLATSVAALIVSRLPEPVNLQELNSWFTANLVLDLATVVAAALAILVVRQIQSWADARAAGLAPETVPRGAAPAGDARFLPPCPRCGSARAAGVQFCGTCGLDLWAAYDQAEGRGVRGQ